MSALLGHHRDTASIQHSFNGRMQSLLLITHLAAVARIHLNCIDLPKGGKGAGTVLREWIAENEKFLTECYFGISLPENILLRSLFSRFLFQGRLGTDS